MLHPAKTYLNICRSLLLILKLPLLSLMFKVCLNHFSLSESIISYLHESYQVWDLFIRAHLQHENTHDCKT